MLEVLNIQSETLLPTQKFMVLDTKSYFFPFDFPSNGNYHVHYSVFQPS